METATRMHGRRRLWICEKNPSLQVARVATSMGPWFLPANAILLFYFHFYFLNMEGRFTIFVREIGAGSFLP
jgi:hypothetical protein